MDRIRIRGGRDLNGSVVTSGSKNASLPILAASLLVDGPVWLRNVPYLKDIDNMLRILEVLGVRACRHPDGSLELEVRDHGIHVAPYDLVRKMRASFVLLGPLWARRGQARVSYPGGCVFGHRPVDLHLKGLRALGAREERRDGYVYLSGPVAGGTAFLMGANGSTVLGTANIVMAASLAQGRATIEGAAMEPEVVDLCEFLNACGAQIRGIGSPRLTVDGVERLHGCDWRVIPDRIEAGTYLVGAAMTNSPVTITHMRPDHILAVIDRLTEAGAKIECGEDWVRNVPTASGRIRAVDVTTLPYPGFPTDLQAQFMTLMTRAEGVSVITEKVYPERFIHATELLRFGAHIRREGHSAIVEGTDRLSGAPVMASDLRASASLVLAGLVASGQTDVQRVYHLDRGYERLEQKLQGIGADIERLNDG